MKLYRKDYYLSDEKAARLLGVHFHEEIDDRLLNTLQLSQQTDSELALHTTNITSSQIVGIPFEESIDSRSIKQFLLILTAVFAASFLVYLIQPQVYKESTQRIVKFNQSFSLPAPFQFNIKEEELRAFRNEDFKLKVEIEGEVLPSKAYLMLGNRKVSMQKDGNTFYHTFERINKAHGFRIEAGGFFSNKHKINLLTRPNINHFQIKLTYPKYTHKNNSIVQNSGNIQVPEGTWAEWQIESFSSDSVKLHFNQDKNAFKAERTSNQNFSFNKQLFKSDQYQIKLSNEYAENPNKILYQVDVIKDRYPEIDVKVLNDSALYSYIILAGNASDDYGLTALAINYRIISNKENRDQQFSFPLTLNEGQKEQSYYYHWEIGDLNLSSNTKIIYQIAVTDNDAINGRKTTKTPYYTFHIPDKNTINDQMEESHKRTQYNIKERTSEAKDLGKSIKELEQRLKGKKNVDWQDRKLIEDLLKMKQDISQKIEKLQQQYSQHQSQQERFSEVDKDLHEKAKKLQKLIEELLDDETKKLYDELSKLLEKKSKSDDFQEILNELSRKENNLEEELERSLELFKQIKFKMSLEEALQQLKEAIAEQEDLLKETQEDSSNSSELAKQQEEIQEQFNEVEKDLNKAKKLNQDLKHPNTMKFPKETHKKVEQEMENSKQELRERDKKKSSESQKNALHEMRQMSKKLQSMTASMEIEMLQENIYNLKNILDNLIHLSFEQERVMAEMADVRQSDPKYLDLSREQLKIQADSKIVHDSLIALASRVFQIESFVTREVNEMEKYLEESAELIKQRKKQKTVAKQQFAMTSMNNLALLLSDVLERMHMHLADNMGVGKKGNLKTEMPNLSELQKKLGKQIQNLKKSGKTGKGLSQELAKLAAEQERIRRAMEKESSKHEFNNSKSIKKAIKQMEQSELDLVNKKLTQELINRQREIVTRLLQAEAAMREQELDKERESKSAKQYEKALPKAFNKYLKEKEKELELLKTIPVKLSPYYKKEVNNYFKEIK